MVLVIEACVVRISFAVSDFFLPLLGTSSFSCCDDLGSVEKIGERIASMGGGYRGRKSGFVLDLQMGM